MRNINFRINSSILRAIGGTALAALIFVGASYAQTQSVSVKRIHHNNLEHSTKVAGKDTARIVDRGAVETAVVAERGTKDTGKGIEKASDVTGDAVKTGTEDAARDTKVAGKKTGRFFKRVGRKIY